MKTTKLIAVLAAILLIPIGAYAQFRPIEPIRPIAPIAPIQPIQPIQPVQPLEPVHPAPAPAYTPHDYVPTEAATSATQKLAQANKTFRFKRVQLETTTEVFRDSDGDWAFKANFIVNGRRIILYVYSRVRAAAVACRDYLNNNLFATYSERSLSLEDVVANARQDISERQGLSDSQISVLYIDEFGDTHVVQISLGRIDVALAAK